MKKFCHEGLIIMVKVLGIYLCLKEKIRIRSLSNTVLKLRMENENKT